MTQTIILLAQVRVDTFFLEFISSSFYYKNHLFVHIFLILCSSKLISLSPILIGLLIAHSLSLSLSFLGGGGGWGWGVKLTNGIEKPCLNIEEATRPF